MTIMSELQEMATERGVALTVELSDRGEVVRIELNDAIERVRLYGRGRTRRRCFYTCRAYIDRVALAKFPKTWDETPKPDWVPEEQWDHIIKFWDWHGGPRQWIDSQRRNKAPETGTRVGVYELKDRRCFGWVCREDSPATVERGRYLHCWNNIGRVVTDDGALLYVSHGRTWIEQL